MPYIDPDETWFELRCNHPRRFRKIIHTVFSSGLNILWCSFCGAVNTEKDKVWGEPRKHVKWYAPTIAGGPLPSLRKQKGKDVAYKACMYCACREGARAATRACTTSKGHVFLSPQSSVDYIRFLDNLATTQFRPRDQIVTMGSRRYWREMVKKDQEEDGD